MRRSTGPTLLLLVLLAPVAAHARWYQVDVVVFRQLSSLSSGGEAWSELNTLPDFVNTVTLSSIPIEAGPAGAAQIEPAGPFQRLAPSDMHLAGVVRRLRQSGAYAPILSAAWRQPSYGVVRARRVYLSDLEVEAGQTPPLTTGPAAAPAPVVLSHRQVEGIVSIKVARLLHIEVDFLYYHEGTPVRLSATRKAKLREIHYFDHPLFGVIVQVSPYVLPDVPDTVEVAPDEPPDPGSEPVGAATQ